MSEGYIAHEATSFSPPATSQVPTMELLLCLYAARNNPSWAEFHEEIALAKECIAAHDAEVRAEVVAKFEKWTNAAISDKREAEVRADERGECVMRIIERVSHSRYCENANAGNRNIDYCICEKQAAMDAAAARGEEQ